MSGRDAVLIPGVVFPRFLANLDIVLFFFFSGSGFVSKPLPDESDERVFARVNYFSSPKAVGSASESTIGISSLMVFFQATGSSSLYGTPYLRRAISSQSSL